MVLVLASASKGWVIIVELPRAMTHLTYVVLFGDYRGKMKRLIPVAVLSICVFLAVTLLACGGDSSDNESDDNSFDRITGWDSVALAVQSVDAQSVTLICRLVGYESGSSLGAKVLVQAGTDVATAPLVTEVAVTSRGGCGALKLTDLTPATTSYIFTLVTGAGSQAAMARLTLPAGASFGSIDEHSITISRVGSVALLASYHLIPGSHPNANHYTLALWSGGSPNFATQTPVATASFDSDSDGGMIYMDNIALRMNQRYTLSLAVSPRPGDVAATVTFDN